ADVENRSARCVSKKTLQWPAHISTSCHRRSFADNNTCVGGEDGPQGCMWACTPQRRFAWLIAPMRLRSSAEILGLPTGLRDRPRQYEPRAMTADDRLWAENCNRR